MTTNSRRAENFLTSYKTWNAKQIITFDTRFRNVNSSRLHLVLVRDDKLVSKITNCPPIGQSDHTVISVTAQLKLKIIQTHTVMSRNFWAADYETINTYIFSQDLRELEVSTSYDKCQSVINKAIEMFIPEKQKRFNAQKPWITTEILKAIKKKREYWDKYIRNHNENNYAKYREQNNLLKKLLNTSRSNYEKTLVQQSSKQFYKYVKRTLNSNVSIVTLKDPTTGEIYTDPIDTCTSFARQFSNFYTDESLQNLPKLPQNTRCLTSINTIVFTPQKVKDALNLMKTDSSPGPDGIPTLLLQRCQLSLSPALSDAMQESMNTGELPASWKMAYVMPIFKKGDRHNPANYRPINLTCNPCKCMEKIIAKELTNFLIVNNIIPESQHGFLPGRSTVSNLLQCVNTWTQDHDGNVPIDVVYLDFEKAFDRVPIQRLLTKLEHHGIRGDLLRWITSFLRDRTYKVRVNGAFSDQFEVRSGVPQGSVLGPLLFLVYIMDLGWNIQSKISFFADDTKIYSDPLSDGYSLHRDLQVLDEWTQIWQLPLNTAKCTVLHIGANNPMNDLRLNNTSLVKVTQQKDLGVIISNDLKWVTHIAKVVKKANVIIALIRRAFQDKSPETILKLYKSHVRPILEYANSIWSPYYVKDIEILERVQRRITKIPDQLKNKPYEERLRLLDLTSLAARRQRGDLIETYKILTGHYSVHLQLFVLNENNNLRGHSKKLRKEKTSKLVRKNFLSNRVVYPWNALQEETVSAPSTNSFKNRLDLNLETINRIMVHYL